MKSNRPLTGGNQSVDQLTGLPDMSRFQSLARAAAAAIESQGERPAAIALDLIGLKAFNTQYGRERGDHLLCAFADVLRAHFGPESCSRFAEDHFYAFASETDLDTRLHDLFERFKRANNGQVLPIRAGVYVCHEGEDIAAIGIDRAKIACDLDRKTWESHVTYFDEEMRDAEKMRIHVLESVDRAIEQHWVQPYYQAVVRSSTSDLCGEEALARWIDPEYGMLSPAQFIPVLEEAGLLYKIDMCIVDRVIADLKAKRERGVHIVPVSINFSQRDFRDLDIAEMLTKKADAAGIPHSLLSVEVIESVASSDPKLFKRQVADLHANGFEVWMDDFGSGYSSLNTLYEFDFDVMKLDMRFTGALETNERAREIVTGVVKIAEQLGVATLAEGVESEEQAAFLESIGCGMLQGFLYSKPLPLDEVCERFQTGHGFMRELPEEAGYWSEIGAISLNDVASTVNAKSMEGTWLDEIPMGIVEQRGKTWRVLRANASYRELLVTMGILSSDHLSRRACIIMTGIDNEFIGAIERCAKSRDWEVVAGRLDYGTGYQTYVKPVVEGPYANAYLIAAFPTLLGSALGSYGDVPVAYAVYRTVLDEARTRVIDNEYVYANDTYCTWGDLDQDSLPGRSFSETWPDSGDMWFPFCYRAAVLGETVHDTLYSPSLGHWLTFDIAPSPVKDCCVFAFTIVDDERRERDEIVARRNTADHIINVMKQLNDEGDFARAMNGALAMLAQTVPAQRWYVMERRGRRGTRAYEWRAKGVQPRDDDLWNVFGAGFSGWVRANESRTVTLIDDLGNLSAVDRRYLSFLKGKGVDNVIIVPLRDGGRFLGCLCADNYTLDGNVDVRYLLSTVAPFMGTVIANHQLVEELEWAGTHDGLTGLLNRRGVDAVLETHLKEHPSEPFVLALLDIDDFKVVNDLHGHGAGDAALRALARAMEERFPVASILGRNGGDELLVFMHGKDVARADELLAAFARDGITFEHEGESYHLSTSAGYASYPDEADTLIAAYTMADAALYAVKLSGKSKARRFSADLNLQYRTQLGFTPRDIAENIPGAIMVYRAGGDGDILFANNELIALFGCESLAEFMDYTRDSFRYTVHPDDSVRVFEEITGQIGLDDINGKYFVDYRIVAKDGTEKRIAENGRLVEIDGIGKVFYVLIVDRDEHERVRP